MSSPSTKTARYGSWKSPITSELIVAQSITLSELCLDGGHVYWLEGRPQEQGRYVIVHASSDGQHTDITPPPYNARTRVHEYGGGFPWNDTKLYLGKLTQDGAISEPEPIA